jgi:hypothetical protein
LELAHESVDVLQLLFGNLLLDSFVSNMTYATMHDIDVDR